MYSPLLTHTFLLPGSYFLPALSQPLLLTVLTDYNRHFELTFQPIDKIKEKSHIHGGNGRKTKCFCIRPNIFLCFISLTMGYYKSRHASKMNNNNNNEFRHLSVSFFFYFYLRRLPQDMLILLLSLLLMRPVATNGILNTYTKKNIKFSFEKIKTDKKMKNNV